jgi:hypothetical protein
MNPPPTTSGAPQSAPQPPAQPPTQSGTAATATAPAASHATTATTTVQSSVAGHATSHPFRAPIAITSFAKNDKLSADLDNWLAWKTRITSVLKLKKMYGIATGSTPSPPRPDTDPTVMDWINPGIVEARANVAEQESSSNEELGKSLTAFVNGRNVKGL